MPEKPTPLFALYSGTALSEPVYRAVDACPPSLDDFRSHEVLGLPYPRALFVRATGISAFRARRDLVRAARRFGLGRCIATLNLSDSRIAWAETGTRGHLTVWAPPSLLVELVVQCDNGV